MSIYRLLNRLCSEEEENEIWTHNLIEEKVMKTLIYSDGSQKELLLIDFVLSLPSEIVLLQLKSFDGSHKELLIYFDLNYFN